MGSVELSSKGATLPQSTVQHLISRLRKIRLALFVSVPTLDDPRLVINLSSLHKFKFLCTISCAMSQDCYSLLSPDRIRLLRLLPNADERAGIQCELFEYSLQESGKGTHLYEALSYVWGGSDDPRSISVDGYDLPVTANLHAVLSRLRDRNIVRILWVDAVCINQANKKEKGHQVQSMAKIFGQAHRVIVWLGEAADNSDRAVEEIRLTAGKQSTNSSNEEPIQQAILALLQRPWFRRIWVREQTLDIIHRNY